MGGSYQMETDRSEQFDIEIPTFSLDSPNQNVSLNQGSKIEGES
jgi:ApaG protein